MKVLLKFKNNISIKDLYNRNMTEYKRKNIGYSRKIYFGDSIGILFVDSAVSNSELEWYWKDQLERICEVSNSELGWYWDWEDSLERISEIKILRNIIKKILIKELQTFFSNNKSVKELLHDFHYYESFEKDEEVEDNLYFKKISNEEKSQEYNYLLNKPYFYLIDDNDNIYIIMDGKLYLSINSLYYTISNGEIIIAAEEITLREYLTPIYEIKKGIHVFNTNEYENILEYLSKFSKLVYKPILEEKIEKTKFNSSSLTKINYDVSFMDFINILEFTNYRRLVLTYKLIEDFKNDSCQEYECKSRHKENKEVYVGLSQNIRYIKENDLTFSNRVLEGVLKFTYVKKVNVLVIELLPKINDICVLNEAILKITLEHLYNVTDLANIKEVYISNNLLGPVIISQSVLEKIPSLRSDRHYELALESEDTLKNVYCDEIRRRKALDSKQKSERRRLVISVNESKNRYNEHENIKANGGTSLIKSIVTKKVENKKDYIIAYHYYSRKTIRYKRTHIIQAPEIIDLAKDRIDLKGFVISFPKGTKEIRGFSNNNELNYQLKNIFLETLRNEYNYGEKVLFIVLPNTLDLSKFEFFDFNMKRKENIMFISDDPKFIEEFRFLRLNYNKTCTPDCCNRIKYCNAPIVYDPDIYDKIWGYRTNSDTLYQDLREKIYEEHKRLEREKQDVEEYRFAELKDLDYIPDIIRAETLKRFLKDLNDKEKLKNIIFFDWSDENLKIILSYDSSMLKIIFMKIIENNNELLNAIDFNDFSQISDNYKRKLFDRYLFLFNNSERDLLNYVDKLLQELVDSKRYYELFYRNRCLPPSDVIDLDRLNYNNSKSRIYYYEIVNKILFNENLVRSINQNEILNDLAELYEIDKNNLDLVLYIYDILRKSNVYFMVGENISKEFIDNLLDLYPYNEEYYKYIKKEYFGDYKKTLCLKW